MPRKIMIVDDETLIRNLLEVALNDAGYDVVQVDDSLQCVFTAMREKPSLIVMDINMPGLNGIEAITLLKENEQTGNIPVIILTGYPTQDNIMNAIKAGAADVVTKAQICLEDILERIESTIEKKEALDKQEAEKTKRASKQKETDETAKKDTPTDTAKDKEPDQKAKKSKKDGEQNKGVQMMNQAVFESRMDKVYEVKTIPFVAKQVMQLANSSGSTTTELVNEIQRDPSLAVKVLRLSNSAFYAAKGRITSLERAVLTIGRRSIGELASGVAVLDHFIKPENEGGLDRLRFWEHCFCCASYARRIAKAVKYKNEEMIFLSGLFHVLGIAVFDDYFIKEFAEVLKNVRENGGGLCKWEKAIIGHNHMEVGSAVMTNWGLNPEIVRPVFLYRDSFESMKLLPQAATILKLSDIFAEAQGYDIGIDESLYFISKDLLEEMGLEDDVLLEIFNKIDEDMRDLRFVFFIHDTSAAASYYEKEQKHALEKKCVSIFREDFFLTDPIEILMRSNKAQTEIENSIAIPKILMAEAAIIEITTPVYLNKAIEPLMKLKDVNPARRPPVVILVAAPLREAAEKLIPKIEEVEMLTEPFSPSNIVELLT